MASQAAPYTTRHENKQVLLLVSPGYINNGKLRRMRRHSLFHMQNIAAKCKVSWFIEYLDKKISKSARN